MPAADATPSWVTHLVNVYYRTTWQQAGLKPPEELQLDPDKGQRLQLPSLEESTAALTARPRALSKAFDNQLQRLALAQLARASQGRVQGALQDTRAVRMLVHSLLQTQAKAKLSPRRLDTRVNDLVVELLESSANSDARFAYAYTHSSLSRDRYPLREIWTARSFRDRTSDATTSVLVDRDVDSCAFLASPTLWRDLTFLWRAAYFTELPLPTNLAEPPVENGNGTKFFEDVGVGLGGFFAFRYRNVLSIQPQAPDPDRYGFDYREHCCLTTSFLAGPLQANGIDVDGGSVSAKREIVGDGEQTRLSGRKRFRGNLPAEPPYRDDFAQLLSVLNPLLVEAGILFGSQLERVEVPVAE